MRWLAVIGAIGLSSSWALVMAAPDNPEAGATDGGAAADGSNEPDGGAPSCSCDQCDTPKVYRPSESPCYRDRDLLDPTKAKAKLRQFTHADRVEMERWLSYYPECKSLLEDAISNADARVHSAATESTDAATNAMCELTQLGATLREVELDQHAAYDVIHEAARAELDRELWTDEVLVGGNFGIGAGGLSQWGAFLRRDLRKHDPPGFRYSLAAGVNWSRNLAYTSSMPDPKTHYSLAAIPSVGFGWTQSWFTVGLGLDWMPSPDTKAVFGRLGVAFLENWAGNDANHCAGFVGDASLYVEPWISDTGARAVLFGASLTAGVGWNRPRFNPDDGTTTECDTPARMSGTSKKAK